MKKRLLSMLLALVMVIGLIPTTVMAVDAEPGPVGPVTTVSTGENSPVQIKKFVTSNGDGTYKITMESYVTGEVKTTNPVPLDIVLVLDVSGSMKDDISIVTSSEYQPVKDRGPIWFFFVPIATNTNAFVKAHWEYGDGEYWFSEDGQNFYPITDIQYNLLTLEYTYTYANSEGEDCTYKSSITGKPDQIYYLTSTQTTVSKMDALKGAVNAFIDATAEKNKGVASDSQHQISLVKFAGKSTNTIGNDTYTEGSYQYNYSQIVDILTVVDEAGANKLKQDVAKLDAAGATSADYGMAHAKTVLKDSTRQKVVVFFTDGEPNHGNGFETNVANTTIGYAKDLKEDGTLIYSVGVLKGADPGDTANRINKYMHAVSSNYPNAENLMQIGDRAEGSNYYKVATDKEGLKKIFGDIVNEVVSGVTADENSILADGLSEYFNLSGVTEVEGVVTGVTVQGASAAGTGETVTWGDPADFSANVSLDGETIKVSGFDYATNCVVKKDGSWTGKKLIVSFDIVPDADANWNVGLNRVPTNAQNSAGLTYGTDSTKLEKSPEVDIEAYGVTYRFDGAVTPDDVTPPTDNKGYLPGATVTVKEEPSAAGYIFSGWKTTDGTVAEGKKFTMPAKNVEFTGSWSLDTGTVTVTKVFKGITADQVETLTGFKLEVKNSDGTVIRTLKIGKGEENNTVYSTVSQDKNPSCTWEFSLETGSYTISENRKDVKLEPYTLTVKDAEKNIITAVNDIFTQDLTVEKNGASIVFQNAYIEKTYTVTYDGNGANIGTVPTDETKYTTNSTVTVLDSGTMDKTTMEGEDLHNYVFAGWNTAADGTGTTYQAGGTFQINANTTLYAMWELDDWNDAEDETTGGDNISDKYQAVVVYKSADENQGTVSPAQEVVTIQDDTYPIPAAVGRLKITGSTATPKTGYVFENWTSALTFTGAKAATLAKQTIHNVEGGKTYTFTAHFDTAVPGLNITKTLKSVGGVEVASTTAAPMAKVGDEIVWIITVNNSGNCDLSKIPVKDVLKDEKGNELTGVSVRPIGTYGNYGDELGTSWTIETLPVGQTSEYIVTYKVTAADAGKTLTNSAVSGETTGNAPGVTVETSGLTVTKTVNTTTAKVGDKLTYTITVTNTGNTTLYRIKLTDAMLNVTETIGTLEPGTSWTESYEYTVKTADAGKTIVNTAVAKASDGTTGSGSSEGTKVQSTQIHVPTLNKKDHVAYIIGYEDNTVRPENNITRAEVATIFFRLLTDDSRARFWSQTNDFSDVSTNDWFNNAVSTMANAGVLTGYPDGTFKPNAPITRAEFAAIAARFSDVTYNGKCSFTDVAATYWAADEIALAEHLGWITGYPDDTFRPGRNITRAEAMTLINRVLERAVEEEHMLKNMVKWIDNSPSAWYYEAVQEATNSHTYTRLSKKVPGQSFYYEDWVAILENPDWAALERAWSKANDQ